MKPELSVVGIDLAKSIFHLVGMDERGKIILRKRLARGEVMPFMAQLPRVTGRDGSVWRGALLGAAIARAGARGEVDGAAIRQTLCEDEQK